MTIQALIAFLVALPRPHTSDREGESSGFLPWERLLSEQRYLRDRANEELRLWARLPRGW